MDKPYERLTLDRKARQLRQVNESASTVLYELWERIAYLENKLLILEEKNNER